MQALLGIGLLLALCVAISEARHSISWRLPALGLLMQLVLLVVLLEVAWVAEAMASLNVIVAAVETATRAGTEFLFGYLGGGELPFAVREGAATYLLAFRVLPQVVVFSALVAVLWHVGLLPAIVRGFGWLLRRSLGISGAEGTAGAATLFMGMVETPLVIRAYLERMQRAELFAVMTFGMSTVAGSVMILYAATLADTIPNVVGHILSASVLNVIGAVYVSRLLVPGTHTTTDAPDSMDTRRYQSFMDALTRGISDGLTLALNVGAMLLVFVSLVALLNGMIGWIDVAGAPLSLQRILGWLFSPVAWLIGIPWAEALRAGELLGTKLVLNELVAYLYLAEIGEVFTERTRLVLMYALCGCAKFGSLGILLGGLTIWLPERRSEVLSLAPLSVVSGTVVTLITGALVAIVTVF